MFRYGDRVRDVINGYTGRVTAMIDYFGRSPVKYVVEAPWNGTESTEALIDEYRLEPAKEEKKECTCYIPKTNVSKYPTAELVEEIPLGRTAESIEQNLSAILDAKA